MSLAGPSFVSYKLLNDILHIISSLELFSGMINQCLYKLCNAWFSLQFSYLIITSIAFKNVLKKLCSWNFWNTRS